MSREHKQPQALVDLIEIALRYRWRFVLPAFLAALLVLAGAFFMPRKYKAESSFERRTDAVLSEIMNRGAAMSFQDPRQAVVDEVTGLTAIDALIEAIRTRPELAPFRDKVALGRQRLQNEIGRRVNVSFDISSNELDRVRLTYISDNPEFARVVVNTLAQSYIDRTRARLDQRLDQSSAFFRNEVDRNRALIEELQTRKLTYEIEHAELLPDSPGNVQVLLNLAQSNLADLRQRRESAALKVTSLAAAVETTPQTTPSLTTGRNPELVRLETKLRDLENQLALFGGSMKMTEKHPDVIALGQQIEQTRLQIASTQEEVVTQKQINLNPKRAELELMLTNARNEVESIDSQLGAVQRDIARYTQQSDRLFPVRADYAKLGRQLDETQRQLSFWEDNLRRVQMALAAETGNRGIQLDLVKPCEPISRPVSPNLTQVLMAALLLAALAGALSVFFAYQSDETFADGQKLAADCKLPLFGTVSELITHRQQRLRSFKRAVLYPIHASAMAAILLLAVGLVYLHLEKPAVMRELLRNPGQFLRQQLQTTATVGATSAQE